MTTNLSAAQVSSLPAPRHRVVAYLAHPVGAPDEEGIAANLANARAWLHWLVDHTSLAVSAPWMPYVQTLHEATYRDRGLADDLAMLGRHDMIVLVGGRISAGMATELDHARSCGLVALDLTRMGVAPPSGDRRRHLVQDLCDEAMLAVCELRDRRGEEPRR